MINFDVKTFRHQNALSASKIDSFSHCSQKYGARYLFNLPDIGNSGSSRGSVCHLILELLVVEKRRGLVKKIIKEGSTEGFPALWRLIVKLAAKFNVNNEADLELIDEFLLVGLTNGFYGPKGTSEILVEHAFDFEVYDSSRGLDYRIRGLIDKVFKVESKTGGIFLEALDMKSSKAKFTGAKIEASVQGSLYQLALKYLFPEIKLKSFNFLFLKFPKQPFQEFQLLSDAALYGFEMFLTSMQQQVDNFTEKNLMDNLGAVNPEMFRLCGKEGVKADGKTLNFMCPSRKPTEYYVLQGVDDKVVASGFTEAELAPKMKAGMKITKKFYTGCGYYFDSQGNPRRLSQE